MDDRTQTAFREWLVAQGASAKTAAMYVSVLAREAASETVEGSMVKILSAARGRWAAFERARDVKPARADGAIRGRPPRYVLHALHHLGFQLGSATRASGLFVDAVWPEALSALRWDQVSFAHKIDDSEFLVAAIAERPGDFTRSVLDLEGDFWGRWLLRLLRSSGLTIDDLGTAAAFNRPLISAEPNSAAPATRPQLSHWFAVEQNARGRFEREERFAELDGDEEYRELELAYVSDCAAVVVKRRQSAGKYEDDPVRAIAGPRGDWERLVSAYSTGPVAGFTTGRPY